MCSSWVHLNCSSKIVFFNHAIGKKNYYFKAKLQALLKQVVASLNDFSL